MLADELRLRYVELDPARSFLARWRGTFDGQPGEVVLSTGWVPVGGDTPVAVSWYPADPCLPALRDIDGELLAWVPFQRAVVRRASTVAKVFATTAQLERSVDARHRLGTAVPAPALLDIDAAAATVTLDLVDGRPLGGADASLAAASAGRLLRQLHHSTVEPTESFGPEAALEQCRAVVERVSYLVPELGPQLDGVLARAGRAVPDGLPLVASHGDFNVGQLVGEPETPTVVDWDTLCRAPAALDLAAYATNLASGRPNDDHRLAEVLDALLSAYGSEPPGLRWYLAATTIRRLDRPLRRAKRDWPVRTERLLETCRSLLA